MADFPDVKPNDETLRLISSNQSYSSVLTGDKQTAELYGDKWAVNLQFNNRHGDEAATLRAWLFSLGGQRTRFKYSPESISNRGTALGSGVVDGAGQLGSAITTTGWTPTQAELLKVGDYFELNGELKIVASLATADGLGDSIIEFAPALRNSPPDGAQIITNKPSATFRLENDEQAQFQIQGPLIYNASLALLEDF